MALSGIILDLDGTLVDSNAAHVEAWRLTFARFDYRVAADVIFNHIGKGGDNFVPAIIGEEADKKDGDALREAQPEEFAHIARSRGLKVFPRVREMLDAFHQRGLRTVLATSSGKKQLALNAECSGLNVSELVDAVVNADDIKSSKPSPDLVSAAAEKLKLSPAQCVMIGDTPFDAESAKGAGVVCFGLTCGGHSAQTLYSNGARRVWSDPADLLVHLDEALHIASPGSAQFSQDLLENLMRKALAIAEQAIEQGEAPIGAVLARGDGDVIAQGFNSQNRTKNKAAHAEIVTLANGAGKAPIDARDLVLVCTLEPCVMCLGAAMESAVDTVVYALQAPADSGTRRVTPPQSPESGMPRIVGNILADESRKLFQKWLKVGNTADAMQVRFVEELLKLTR